MPNIPARLDDGGVGSRLAADVTVAPSDWLDVVPDGKSGPAEVLTIAGSGINDGGS